MIRKLLHTLMIFGILVALKWAIGYLKRSDTLFARQQELIRAEELEPALLFYTESDKALEASHILRVKLE